MSVYNKDLIMNLLFYSIIIVLFSCITFVLSLVNYILYLNTLKSILRLIETISIPVLDYEIKRLDIMLSAIEDNANYIMY
jgi:hypothetical protein